MEEILLTFTDVFNPIPGRVYLLQHSINTRDSPPLRTAPHRLPVKWKDQLLTEVKDLLEAGFIRVSHSPWSSPIVPVRKKEGSIRLCVHFHRINRVTVPDSYLMSRVNGILDCLGEAKYLTKLDLNKGLHQVPLYQSDIEETAFCTEWGKYEYFYMPFGLRNAPSTFQRLMDLVLTELLHCARAYIDDVVIFSTSWDEHKQHLKLF